MIEQKAMTVRIDTDLHRQVRIRAFEEGVAVEALLRGWLRAYADGTLDGNMAVPAPRPTIDQAVDPRTGTVVATRPSRTPRTKTCPHRVPAGSFCKRCDEGETT